MSEEPSVGQLKQQALDKVKVIKANLAKHRGMPGKNPFMWIKDMLEPHLIELESANPLQRNEAAKSILALPDDPDPDVSPRKVVVKANRVPVDL